jgi:hypothetical protein
MNAHATLDDANLNQVVGLRLFVFASFHAAVYVTQSLRRLIMQIGRIARSNRN